MCKKNIMLQLIYILHSFFIFPGLLFPPLYFFFPFPTRNWGNTTLIQIIQNPGMVWLGKISPSSTAGNFLPDQGGSTTSSDASSTQNLPSQSFSILFFQVQQCLPEPEHGCEAPGADAPRLQTPPIQGGKIRGKGENWSRPGQATPGIEVSPEPQSRQHSWENSGKAFPSYLPSMP